MKRERAAKAYKHVATSGGDALVNALTANVPGRAGKAMDRVFYARVPGLDRLPSLPTPREYVSKVVHDPLPVAVALALPTVLSVRGARLASAGERKLVQALNNFADRTPREVFRRRVAATLKQYGR
mgnify:CR=1 FL=1